VGGAITLDFVGGASTVSGGSIEGAGTLLMSGGNTTLSSGASVSVADLSESGAGTTLIIDEALAYAGDFSQGAGSTTVVLKGDEFSLTGTASLSGKTSGAGTLALAGGSATIDGGATLSVSNWSISGAGTDVTLDENLRYAGSFSEGADDTLVLSGGYLLLSGGNDSFAGATVDGSNVLKTEGTITVSGLMIGGTVEWKNTKTVNEIGGSATIGDASGDKAFLDNTSTGTYDILDDSGINRGSSMASHIENAGLFEKTGGTGVSTIVPRVTNIGTIEVTSGTLDFKGGISGTGSDMISNASILEFGAGVSSSATVGDQDIQFSTGGGTLDLLAPTSFYGEISNFGSGDGVRLNGSWAFSTISDVDGVTTLTLASTSTTHSFEFVGNYMESNFHITSGATTTIRYHA
jgi:fibronectin-binding autotransporter adhesin